jgi:Fic family protein
MFQLIKRGVGQPLSISAATVCEFNRLAVAGISPDAGQFRTGDVEVVGSNHVPPHHAEVPGLVDQMCDYLNRADHDEVHASAYAMWRLNWIHPFGDGNGRASRALSYLVLNIRLGRMLSGRSTIPDYLAADRRRYWSALGAADAAQSNGHTDVTEMETLLGELVERQLQDAKRAAAGEYVEAPKPPGPVWDLD